MAATGSRLLTVSVIILRLLPITVLSCNRSRVNCGSNSMPQIKDYQMNKINEMATMLKTLQDSPKLLSRDEYQVPVFNLTSDQRKHILEHHGDLFKEESELPPIPSLASSSSTSSSSSSRVRRQSLDNTDGVRVCPASNSFQKIFLSITAEGTLVQVVQLPEEGKYQWFIQEECIHEYSHVVDVRCVVSSRLVPAFVLNLNTTTPPSMHLIRTDSCVGSYHRLSTH